MYRLPLLRDCVFLLSFQRVRSREGTSAHRIRGKIGKFEAIYCQHCDEPLCVAACPNEVAVKDEETGIVKINPMRCIGCKTCTFACSLSVLWFNESRHISMKCDFCDGDPQCAKFCSPQAIRIVNRSEAWEFNMKNYMEAST